MQTIFSTERFRPRDRFRQWRDVCEDRLVPMDQRCLSKDPFDATIQGANIGSLNFTKFALRNLRASTTSQTLRHENHKTDCLFMSMVLTGTVHAEQNNQSSTDNAGDFAIRDTNTPWTIEHNGYSEVLAIAIPRERLERTLGSARIFAGLTIDGHLPTATLTRSFLCNLMRESDRLSPLMAERMAGIAIDLVVASLAERLAQEVPRPVSGTILVQRAKAYIQANLGNASLDPPQIATAVGVSLRRLQELFHKRGQHISEYIWRCRLESAAQILTDPGSVHLQISVIAYGTGFATQAHFSRRFKDRYGLSPRDYRHRALVQSAVI